MKPVKTLKISPKQNAYTLIELLIVASILAFLGLLIARITEGFVEAYIRARDHIDLQNVGTSLIENISDGDSLYFDGLKGAVEIIEANDKELSFVPQYRETSLDAGEYSAKLFDNVETLGPPTGAGGVFSGGLRINYNRSNNRCELRYYLSKHPRAGSQAPQIYLKYGLTSGDIADNWTLVPVQYSWITPKNQAIPLSYVVFSGGFSSLEFENKGTVNAPSCPTSLEVARVMRSNKGQLFPDPFNRPRDKIAAYYHPETDPGIISNQTSLVAHLFIRNAYPDQITRFGILGTDLAGIFRIDDPNNPQALHPNSLVLLYDQAFKMLPLQQTLLNSNLKRERLQFLKDAPEETNLKPTTFSYYGTQNATQPLPTELIAGRNQIAPELIHNIGLVRFDLLMMIGGDTDLIDFSQITTRNHSQLVALDSLRFSTNLHTHRFSIFSGAGNDIINSRRGFSASNCLALGGFEGTNKCRQISAQFPGGQKINLSQTFYLNQIEKDSESKLDRTGFINLVVERNSKIYKVKIDFDKRRITVLKKATYASAEPNFDDQVETCPEPPFKEGTTCFALDSPDLISLTNLQKNGFQDEGFNYSDKEVWSNHLNMIQPEDTSRLFIEISDTSNIEGFSLTYTPR